MSTRGEILIIAALSIFPIGVGTSLSRHVKASLQALEDAGVGHRIGPMSTTIETETLDQLFDAVKVAHDAQRKLGAHRIYMVLNIDDRRDKNARITSKLAAVNALA
jgi:uncharacterized protein (TIGR00106 family)